MWLPQRAHLPALPRQVLRCALRRGPDPCEGVLEVPVHLETWLVGMPLHPSQPQIFTRKYMSRLTKGALWLALVGLVQGCGHLSKYASEYQPQDDTGFRSDPVGLLRGSLASR